MGSGSLVLIISLLVTASFQNDVPLRMPGVSPKQDDTYLCTAHKVTEQTFVVGFEPQSVEHRAHHMLIYACQIPGFINKTWNCGEMKSDVTNSEYDIGATCQSGPSIVYAWAMDAPSLTLPKDVGFKVGPGTRMPYLVLQIHYKHAVPKDASDTSGIILHTTSKPLPKLAGVSILLTGGFIPALSRVYMETACPVEENVLFHPFAFRTHTHKHGRVVSGYRIRNGKWTELGRKNPRLPQMFYNTTTPNVDIRKDDILAARCTMENNGRTDVAIGSTQTDEMCNFYLMYWTDTGRVPNLGDCYSDGFPEYSWKRSVLEPYLNIEAVPKDASTRPDTGETYPQTVSGEEYLYNAAYYGDYK